MGDTETDSSIVAELESTAIDLAFFIISGTLGDWYLLKEGIKGFLALRNLYLSQMTVGLVATSVAAVAATQTGCAL